MNPIEYKVNYHEALEQISTKLDPILKKLQEMNRIEDPQDGVLSNLLTAPLKDMKRLTQMFQDISNFNISSIPIFGTIIAGLISPFTHWPSWVEVAAMPTLFIVLYLSLLPSYFKKMVTFEDPSFHLNTYKKYRKQEYNLISYAVEENMSYKGLYEFVTGILTKQDNTSKTIEIVTNQYDKEKEEMRAEYKERLREVYNNVESLNTIIEELQQDAEAYDTSLIYLDELLTDINVILYRIVNRVFGVSDLKFLTGFTIYDEIGRDLVKIYDEGTTGSSPNFINLDDERYKEWTSVIVAKQKLRQPKISQPRDNYNVISYRMPLSKTSNEVWVFNFHINRETNRKAWYLLTENDIIAKEEIFRLFHALSLMLFNQLGGVENGDSRRANNGTNKNTKEG